MNRILVLICGLTCLAGLKTLEAKGPKVGGGFGLNGRGNATRLFSNSHGTGLGSRVLNGAAWTGNTVVDGIGRGLGTVSDTLTGHDRVPTVPRSNDERNLLEQQQIAEKLRAISDRTGNQNLKTAADKMDQNALNQYEKRQQQIDAGEDDREIAPPPPESPLANQRGGKLSDPIHERDQKLLNEERQLQQQLDVAQKLRDLAARNGNQNLIDTAERMEVMAAERYASQLERLSVPRETFVDAPPAPAIPVGTSADTVLAQ